MFCYGLVILLLAHDFHVQESVGLQNRSQDVDGLGAREASVPEAIRGCHQHVDAFS